MCSKNIYTLDTLHIEIIFNYVYVCLPSINHWAIRNLASVPPSCSEHKLKTIANQKVIKYFYRVDSACKHIIGQLQFLPAGSINKKIKESEFNSIL